MRPILFLSLLFCLTGCLSKAQHLKGDYYFIMRNGGVTKMTQRHDTLFESKYYPDRPDFTWPENMYKVLDKKEDYDRSIFKLEQLDTLKIPTTTGDRRYAIYVFSIMDPERISLVHQLLRLSKKDISENFVDTLHTKDRFGLTYFSADYFEQLKKLKTITSKKDVEEIAALFTTAKYLQIKEQYERSHLPDFYAGGFVAEMFNRACIEKEFNPIGAADIANRLMRPKEDD